MSIIKDSKNINKVFYGETSIKSIYLGDKAVYNYIPPTPNNLSFEFTGDSCLFYLNGQEFTATTSPYTVDVNTLLKGQPLTSMNFSGSKITKFISIDNTSTITDLSNLFFSCYELKSINLTNFDTSNVTTLGMAFTGIMLPTVDLSSFRTPKLVNMSSMLNSSQITSIDLSSFDVSKVTKFSGLFGWANNLQTIDLSNWHINEAVDISDMCDMDNPQALKTIIIRNSDETTINKIKAALITDHGDTTEQIQLITE